VTDEEKPPRLPVRPGDIHSTASTLIDQNTDETHSVDTAVTASRDDDANSTVRRKKGWFSRRSSQPTSEKSAAVSSNSMRSALDGEDDDLSLRLKPVDSGSASWGVGDDVQMGFG
jgi:hypothetical protein